jgi:hypothetical protein
MAHDWFRRRFLDNAPYDRIVRGVLLATSRDGRSAEAWRNDALDLLRAKTGFNTGYAHRDTLDHYWRPGIRVQPDYLESLGERTAFAFLGVRLECARCHDHPVDGWTVADHRAFANLFAQVRWTNPVFPKGIKPTVELALLGSEISLTARPHALLTHSDSGAALPPRLLGGAEVAAAGDAREAVLDWMLRPDNPFFAPHFVNLIWTHYLGVSPVEAVDRPTSALPPAHATLLDRLARDFVDHGFDIRRLERTILLSRTYQLSAKTNDGNKRDRTNFSHSSPHRPGARVASDMFHTALELAPDFGPDVPAGLRAIEVMHDPPAVVPLTSRDLHRDVVENIVARFGRTDLVSRCDFDGPGSGWLAIAGFSATGAEALLKKSKRVQRLAASARPFPELLDECFLATLTRYPTAAERKSVDEYLQAHPNESRTERLVTIFWALVNSREYLHRQ